MTINTAITSSVMEYAPTNVWPKGVSRGDYFQAGPGPYDLHAIHWGYAAVSGAHSPQDELPTLRRWASEWSNPWYRFAMDEDVQYFNAHAIDPRVSQGDLTNDSLSWCAAQWQLSNQLIQTIPSRYPRRGEAFDSARTAFGDSLYQAENCILIASHYIGGEYVNLRTPLAQCVASLKRFDYTYDTADLSAAIRNSYALGAEVFLAGVVGDDVPGQRLRHAIEALGMHQEGLETHPARPTSTRTSAIRTSQWDASMRWGARPGSNATATCANHRSATSSASARRS